jgi:hypothetical protein
MQQNQQMRDRLQVSHLALVVMVGLYGPAFLWAQNVAYVIDPGRLLILALLGVMVSCGVYLVSLATTRHSVASAIGAFVVMMGSTQGSVFAERMGTVAAALVILAAAILTHLIASFLAQGSLAFLVELVPWGLAVFLGLSITYQAVADFRTIGDSAVVSSVSVLEGPASSVEDVLVIVLDGYTNPHFLEEEFPGYDPVLVRELISSQFWVPQSGWGSYTLTFASIPSMMDLVMRDFAFERGGIRAGVLDG